MSPVETPNTTQGNLRRKWTWHAYVASRRITECKDCRMNLPPDFEQTAFPKISLRTPDSIPDSIPYRYSPEDMRPRQYRKQRLAKAWFIKTSKGNAPPETKQRWNNPFVNYIGYIFSMPGRIAKNLQDWTKFDDIYQCNKYPDLNGEDVYGWWEENEENNPNQ